jgi:exonuclease VII small subunit
MRAMLRPLQLPCDDENSITGMEERISKLEAATRELQDAMVVMAHLEKRLAETSKELAQRMVTLEVSNAEAHEKLNALVHIVDSWIKGNAQM